ncbi:Zinc/iron permease [Chlamydoabsidia padenii]|nr:Zinc/iron permease [Chlamydoabsidia padenii]
MILETSTGNTEGWAMVSISSAACVVGASIVFIDKVWPRQQGSILTSRAFLASSMALASGVLLISSLAVLLPESQARLHSTPKAYGWFLVGASLTLCLSRIIHWCTPQAIHSCGSTSPTQHERDLSTSTSFSPTMIPSIDRQGEQQKLIQSTMDYGSTVLPNAHFRFHEHHHDLEDQRPLHDHHQHDHHSTSNNTHGNGDHIDLDQEKEHFWSIGIQTAVAICVHKFPEGLIMFISSQASSSLGISVAAAMSIHNLTEGFMMALPIYYATGSRMNAFVCASLMGGLSQPLGALIGLWAFRSVTKDQEDVLFGVTFGVISGMMSFITIQSMLPQAIKVDIHHNYVVLFFFLGVMLVGLTSLLKVI